MTLPGIKKSARKSVRKSGRKATTNLKNKAKDVVKESVDKVKPSGKKPAANRLKALAKIFPEKMQSRKKVAIEKSEKEDKHIGMIEAAQEGIPAANEMESKSILVSFKSLFRDCKSCQLIMTLCHENVS